MGSRRVDGCKPSSRSMGARSSRHLSSWFVVIVIILLMVAVILLVGIVIGACHMRRLYTISVVRDADRRERSTASTPRRPDGLPDVGSLSPDATRTSASASRGAGPLRVPPGRRDEGTQFDTTILSPHIIYFTANGTCYHTNNECFGLRNLQREPTSRRACTLCCNVTETERRVASIAAAEREGRRAET